MSVATLPSQHAAGNWSAATHIPFTVKYTPVSGHPTTHNVTGGNVDDDTANNTAKNNRLFDNFIHSASTAERFGGSTEMVKTKIVRGNVEHFLRSLGPDGREDEELVNGVKKVLTQGSEFSVQVPTDLSLKLKQKREELDPRVHYVLEEEGEEAVRPFIKKVQESTMTNCVKWLKGEDIPDRVEARLDQVNIHNFLSDKSFASLAKDEEMRKAVQKVMLGGTSTIELSYDDRESLFLGWTENRNIQRNEQARNGGKDDTWRTERMKKTCDLARTWYSNAGVTADEWKKTLDCDEMRSFFAQQRKRKEQQEAKSKAKSKPGSEDGSWSDTPTSSSGDETTAILTPFNVDFYLQNFSVECTKPESRAAVFAAATGRKARVKLSDKDSAIRVELSSNDTSKAVSEFRQNKDEEGFKSWGKARQEKIKELIEKWETDSKTSFKDWGKPPSSAQGGGGSTAPIDTASQTQTQPSSSPSPAPSTSPSSKFDMSDLKDTVITKYNLPELLSCYTNPEKAGSFDGIQSFLYEALPPNHKKIQNIYQTVPLLPEPTTATATTQSGSASDKDKKKKKDEEIIKLKLPSKFSDHLTKITADSLAERDSILRSSNGDENSEQMRLFNSQKNHAADTIFKNWKACHTKSDRTPLSSSSTSIPGDTRKPISPAKKLAMTYDKNKIKQVDQEMSDPSTGPYATDHEWQTNMHALQTADGYGKHGLKFEKQDIMRGKRTWEGLSSDGGSHWQRLNDTYLGSGGSSAATPMVSAAA